MVRLGIALVAALFMADSAAANSISARLGTASPSTYAGRCPAEISFAGAVTAPAPGEVEFRFIRSDGGVEPAQKLFFEHAGTLPVGMTWHIGGPKPPRNYRGWVAIQILRPQSVQSTPASFNLRCRGTQYAQARFDDRWPSAPRGLSGLPAVDPPPVISLGPSYDPYLKWNGRRISGTPALEGLLRDHRRESRNCQVRIAPAPGADYQMIASLVNAIQRTDECRMVDIGVIGSIGKAAKYIDTAAANLPPIISIGPRGRQVLWNGEPVGDQGALEMRLRDYRALNKGDCSARIESRGADYSSMAGVFDAMTSAGCSIAGSGMTD